ncbi:MAG TPA: hypothetical protein DC017_16645 [Candidatus Wallbacteria bacterium]|nr:hypothetical protein [Candidatus Wallbacteria bacterium]
MSEVHAIIRSEVSLNGRPARYFEFEYHRYSLAAWRDDRLRNAPASSMAITIDRHRDFVMAEKQDLEKFAGYGDCETSFIRNVHEIPAIANNDFIAYAFYDDYCSDAIAIAYEDYYEIEKRSMVPLNAPFFDRRSNPHHLLCLPSMQDVFAPDCDFERTPTYKFFYDRLAAAASVILDIDLDYFTYQSPDDGIFVRREEDIRSAFARIKPAFSRVMSRVTTIAVARESVCCGGRQNAAKIREILLDIFKTDYNLLF